MHQGCHFTVVVAEHHRRQGGPSSGTRAVPEMSGLFGCCCGAGKERAKAVKLALDAETGLTAHQIRTFLNNPVTAQRVISAKDKLQIRAIVQAAAKKAGMTGSNQSGSASNGSGGDNRTKVCLEVTEDKEVHYTLILEGQASDFNTDGTEEQQAKVQDL
eukprot:1525738-Amphidinium_carterae.1